MHTSTVPVLLLLPPVSLISLSEHSWELLVERSGIFIVKINDDIIVYNKPWQITSKPFLVPQDVEAKLQSVALQLKVK